MHHSESDPAGFQSQVHLFLVRKYIFGVSEYQDYQFQDYIRYGLELAEYHLLESYDGVKDKTDETDRVFLESVQVCFFFAFLL